MTCEKCDGTGSLSKNITGYLDCGFCDAAQERMRVEAWARRAAPGAGLIDVWTIYQHGKQAGATEVARTGA
jgi:hypothetical protein